MGRGRAAALAALSTVLAAVGHLAAGGAVPDLALLAVLGPLLAGAGLGAARRCRSLAAVLAALAAGQFALHLLLELLHGAHAAPVTATAAPAPSGLAMIAGHAVGTVLVAIALRHADRATAAVAHALRRVLPRRLAAALADRPLPTLAIPGFALPARLARVLAVAQVRRGPPVTC